MRQPLSTGTPINARRFKRWIDRFASYRQGVTRNSIEDWLAQFEKKDQDLAARTLDAVMFFDQSLIASNFRSILQSLPGWHKNKSNRSGRWFFVAMSSSAGESGDSMLHQFRVANGLDLKIYNEMFISRRDLVAQKLSQEDTLVFIDDFTGTGDQVCKAWNDPETAFGELVAGVGKIYLVVVAATQKARERISQETSLSVVPGHALSNQDDIFSSHCRHFTKSDKEGILKYSQRADKKKPAGFGDCGLLVVFCHRCPNNSLPILHATTNKWTGIFPRND